MSWLRRNKKTGPHRNLMAYCVLLADAAWVGRGSFMVIG